MRQPHSGFDQVSEGGITGIGFKKWRRAEGERRGRSAGWETGCFVQQKHLLHGSQGGGASLSRRNLVAERVALLWWASASFIVQPEGASALRAQLIRLCDTEKPSPPAAADHSRSTDTHMHSHALAWFVMPLCIMFVVIYSTAFYVNPNAVWQSRSLSNKAVGVGKRLTSTKKKKKKREQTFVWKQILLVHKYCVYFYFGKKLYLDNKMENLKVLQKGLFTFTQFSYTFTSLGICSTRCQIPICFITSTFFFF